MSTPVTIDQYRAGFPDILERRVVENEIQLCNNILTNVLCPISETLADTFKGQKFKSPELQRMESSYKSSSAAGSRSLLEAVSERLTGLDDVCDMVDRLIRKHVPKRLASAKMTYKQIALFRLADMMAQLVEYHKLFFFYVLSQENAVHQKVKISALMNRSWIKQVEEGFARFCTLSRMYLDDPKELEKRLEQTPDLIVAEADTGAVRSIYSSGEAEPVMEGFIATRWNPIWRIGSIYVQYQAQRYKEAQALLSAYEVQLAYHLQLRESQDEVDPALENKIEELTILVEEMRAKITKWGSK